MVSWVTPTAKMEREGRRLSDRDVRTLVGRCGFFVSAARAQTLFCARRGARRVARPFPRMPPRGPQRANASCQSQPASRTSRAQAPCVAARCRTFTDWATSRSTSWYLLSSVRGLTRQPAARPSCRPTPMATASSRWRSLALSSRAPTATARLSSSRRCSGSSRREAFG
eukprot:2102418-Prymnesium_polylepis.1